MPGPFEEMATLDRVVHEPVRLAILTALGSCRRADFTFLQKLIGLTHGNASTHLARLEEAGLIQVEKTFAGKVPRTVYRLTPEGRASVKRYWEQLDRLRNAAAHLQIVPVGGGGSSR
jgi:DNA-binding MarR family transcriptional regulator